MRIMPSTGAADVFLFFAESLGVTRRGADISTGIRRRMYLYVHV